MGPLTESWRSQLGTPVFCAPYAVTKDDQYRTQPAAPDRCLVGFDDRIPMT